jgi:uncharacterized membrane protein YdbT with pleckstrin-like domain
MGKYVNSNLMSGETVIYETKVHWIGFLVGILLLPVYGVGILTLIGAFINRSCEFAVTSRRVIIKTGFISRSVFEINLDKIESIIVDQGFFGRIFNFGTINVSGVGGTSPAFSRVSDPIRFRHMVSEAIKSQS